MLQAKKADKQIGIDLPLPETNKKPFSLINYINKDRMQ